MYLFIRLANDTNGHQKLRTDTMDLKTLLFSNFHDMTYRRHIILQLRRYIYLLDAFLRLNHFDTLLQN